ncbi:MAG TPA: hypothetical protein VMS76_19695 [Planctomycetota bacterium]|nr:hypothetical protein [Planctomycetota bacterium]
MLAPLAALLGAASALLPWPQAGDPDADRDGLSDFAEVHKYLTDPKKADSDGDGIPDGDWDERREYAYTVRAVMHVMAPFDVATMNDDYQDVRVLDVRPDLIEFEVVVYPFATVAEAIEPDRGWRKPPAALKRYLEPGTCCNWDKGMQRALEVELAREGVELAKLDDVEAARAVSKWLMDRSKFEDSFATFAVDFRDGKLVVPDERRADLEETARSRGRTLAEQWDREIYGKGMFETRLHGSCTSSAIYLSTGLKAAGIPTRTIVCVPVVDANDEREVGWISTRISHVGVRQKLLAAAERNRGKWASHTFNEVYVGRRWRRLNYTKLGAGVLDDGMGLFVHVHTFDDHSKAGLVGWGRRESHPQHAALFGGPNPYSCVSLSDRFGPYCDTVNAPLLAVRELPIERLYWYDDPQRSPALDTRLPEPDGAAYFVAHFDPRGVDGSDAREFYEAAPKDFVLRAEGREDVPARGMLKFWGDRGDFILRIEPSDYARMERGVPYRIVWSGDEAGLRWKVAEGATIERPKG